MSIISRNGKAYSDSDVQIAMLGSIDYEVVKLSYGVKQIHKPNYSFGSEKPSSYSKGKKEYSCALTLRLKSASELEKAAQGDLLAIKPFNIVSTFVDDENEMIVDVIKVKFASQGRDIGGSDDLVQEFEMFCLDIDFNTVR